jgi:hypothetical protein
VTPVLRLWLLGLWGGALLAWSVLFVPAAFATLPGTELAGGLAGVTLDRLDGIGALMALACAALGLWGYRLDTRSSGGQVRCLLPLLAGAGHAVSVLFLSPAARAIRLAAGGSVSRLAAEDPALLRFSQLHRLSVLLFGVSLLVVLTSALWDLRALAGMRSSKEKP